MSFSKRHGHGRPYPPRDTVEEAPPRLRAFLLQLMLDEWGALGAYHRMCELLGVVPEADVWSNQGASNYASDFVNRLEWFEVLDLLEEVSSGPDDEINDVLARCGLAYEMVDNTVHLLDAEGDALGVSGTENEATDRLKKKFAPVRKQYERALDALHGRPPNLEKAVSEAVGALEAVATIRSGKKDFGAAIDTCFSGRTQFGGLAQSLKSLYGWASQVPGARHGRHSEPDLGYEDAFLAVRLSGVAIVYLIDTE